MEFDCSLTRDKIFLNKSINKSFFFLSRAAEKVINLFLSIDFNLQGNNLEFKNRYCIASESACFSQKISIRER